MIRVAFVDQRGDLAGGAEESLALLLRFLGPDIAAHAFFLSAGPFAERVRRSGVPVEIFDADDALQAATRERPRLSSALAAIPLARRLARALRASDVDLVYTNTMKAHVVGGLAARLAGMPCIAHFRDLLEGRSRLVIRSAASLFTRTRIANSLAVSRNIGLPHTHVVPNPVDLDAYRDPLDPARARAALHLPAGVPLIGLVGRINRWKGHDRFLRIAARLHDGTDAHFAIVGEAVFRDRDFADSLPALARDLGIAERVHFVPWLEDPRAAYAAIDVLCNTSLREPFGRTTIEAAAAGVPTVCFADGGAAEALVPGVTGRAVTPGDEAAFAAALSAYLADPALRARDGAAAREHAAHFAAGRHAERVAEIIRSAVA